MKLAAPLLCLLLSACAAGRGFDHPMAQAEADSYATAHPYYVELNALSAIDKKPGFGAEIISGGPGGHTILYLNGVCRDGAAHYPVLKLCDAGGHHQGVGLSVNAHFDNAKWVATPGPDLLYQGGIDTMKALEPEGYLTARANAEAAGIYDGVTFHKEVFADQPAAVSGRDWMYEISIGTDYATGLARDRYAARIPVTRAQMEAIVVKLNADNLPYREGKKHFEWDVFNDNCAHMAHNALARVGVWRDIPVDRSYLVSTFDFPVPKNEFVNLMRRGNDMDLIDVEAIYRDDAARREFLEYDSLPTEPGVLASATPMMRPNAIYGEHPRLIFFDEPNFGHYEDWFDAIFTEPRYTSAHANLIYFGDLYTRVLAARRTPETYASWRDDHATFEDFHRRYYIYIAHQKAAVDDALAGGK